jgi:hypothetical protein
MTGTTSNINVGIEMVKRYRINVTNHCSHSIADYMHQDIHTIRDLFLGTQAMEAGVMYLQDESREVQLKEGGRKWSIYGSPVGFISRVIFALLTVAFTVDP